MRICSNFYGKNEDKIGKTALKTKKLGPENIPWNVHASI